MSNAEENARRLVKPVVRSMFAYHVPDASGLLKLDAMENPYQWDESVRNAWLEALKDAAINRYPNPAAAPLRERLARVMNLPAGLEIMLGNGSDEIIQILAMALAQNNASILSVDPGFVMYRVIAETVGMDYHGIPLCSDFSLDMPALLDAIHRHQPALLFFAVPNNPTGNSFPEAEIRKVIEASRGLVVIDEAYMAFTNTDFLPLAAEYDNVVVMRTLSKVGLAGLRLGMLIGKAAWIGEFNKIRLPYNINVLTQLTASFALDHYPLLQQQANAIVQQREALFSTLQKMAGVEVFPSEANFLLVRTRCDAKAVFEKMREQGVLVKCLTGGHPLLHNCLRLTVGTAEEDQQMLAALSRALATISL